MHIDSQAAKETGIVNTGMNSSQKQLPFMEEYATEDEPCCIEVVWNILYTGPQIHLEPCWAGAFPYGVTSYILCTVYSHEEMLWSVGEGHRGSGDGISRLPYLEFYDFGNVTSFCPEFLYGL